MKVTEGGYPDGRRFKIVPLGKRVNSDDVVRVFADDLCIFLGEQTGEPHEITFRGEVPQMFIPVLPPGRSYYSVHRTKDCPDLGFDVQPYCVHDVMLISNSPCRREEELFRDYDPTQVQH